MIPYYKRNPYYIKNSYSVKEKKWIEKHLL
jgi:hypothetical protein